jgi:hypothetical protein
MIGWPWNDDPSGISAKGLFDGKMIDGIFCGMDKPSVFFRNETACLTCGLAGFTPAVKKCDRA